MTIQANQGPGVSIFGATSAGGGGGSTSPGGSSGQVQYNNGGSFGGMSGTSWDDTNRALTLTGATVTTSQPVLNLSQTWNAGAVTFTGLKFNAATGSNANSASASLLLDLQLEGSSKVYVTKAGQIYTAIGQIAVPGALQINSGNTNDLRALTASTIYGTAFQIGSGITPDVYLSRAAAATLQLGSADAVDATSPVAQTLQVQSAVAGASATTVSISGTALSIAGTITGTIRVGHTVTGTGVSAGTVIQSGSGNNWVVNNSQTVGPVTMYFNAAGANFTINGSRGSGPSAGGSIIFQVAPAGAAATTAQNAYATALTIGGDKSVTATGNLVTNSFYVTASSRFAADRTTIGYSVDGVVGGNTCVFGFVSSSTAATGSPDVILRPDAANTLALRNGGTAASPVPQTFNLYNFYVGASDYERGFVRWATNVLEIGAEKAGTGSNRMTRLTTGGNFEFKSTGNAAPTFQLFGTDRSVTLTAQSNMLAISNGGIQSQLDYTSGASNNFALNSMNGNAATRYFALSGSAVGMMQISDGLGKGSGYGAGIEMWEMTAPAAPGTNGVRIYAEDNGSGKTRLMALFPTGAAQQIAIEP